jgi:hypothetical protein
MERKTFKPSEKLSIGGKNIHLRTEKARIHSGKNSVSQTLSTFFKQVLFKQNE